MLGCTALGHCSATCLNRREGLKSLITSFLVPLLPMKIPPHPSGGLHRMFDLSPFFLSSHDVALALS